MSFGINVSKKSWHYRMVNRSMVGTFNSPSENLCVYFWQVVFVLLKRTFFSVLIALAVIAPVVTIGDVNGLWDYTAGSGMAELITFFVAVTAIEIGAGSLLLIFAFFYSIINVCEWIVKNRPRRERTEPSLLVEYVKAKRQKICPRLKFKD